MIINCPHCNHYIEILELNCGIFRCGVFKDTLQPINPHMAKTECDSLVINNTIFGCSKPFQIKLVNNIFVIEICDYI